jgi:zinc/manganese transport system ATP-binding protein
VDLVRLGLDGDRWGVPLPVPRLSKSRDHDGARRIREVVELVGASAYAERPIGTLSGGEQQRLLIAQAIVHRPDLLLLDEPLASLDYPNQMAITGLIGRISREQEMTVIMVTHDVNPIIGQAQEVIYIAKQGVVSGTPREVITAPTLTRIYGYRVEVHYTADGRVLVVGDPTGGAGKPSAAAKPGLKDEEEHECCDH